MVVGDLSLVLKRISLLLEVQKSSFHFLLKKTKTFSARTNVRRFLYLSTSATFAGCTTAAEEEIHRINIISMQINRRLYLFSDLWREKKKRLLH